MVELLIAFLAFGFGGMTGVFFTSHHIVSTYTLTEKDDL